MGMQNNSISYPNILQVSEICPNTPECLRIILMETNPEIFVVMMEGHDSEQNSEWVQIGTAKQFKTESDGMNYYNYLVYSLSTGWVV